MNRALHTCIGLEIHRVSCCNGISLVGQIYNTALLKYRPFDPKEVTAGHVFKCTGFKKKKRFTEKTMHSPKCYLSKEITEKYNKGFTDAKPNRTKKIHQKYTYKKMSLKWLPYINNGLKKKGKC